MSKLISILFFLAYISSCSIESGKLYKTQATIFLINNTSDTIFSEDHCNRDIAPKDTLVIVEKYNTEHSERPSINNYIPFSGDLCYLFYYDIEKQKCQHGFRNIENYENKKEISPLVFELTFRFTEAKKKEASICEW